MGEFFSGIRHVAAQFWWQPERRANSRLGRLLTRLGRGKRLREAEQFREAAEAGDMHAQFEYGLRVRKAGLLAEAMVWFRRAAQHNHVPSMVNLAGLLHQFGNNDEALDWYERAAAVGDPLAMYNAHILHAQLGHEDTAMQYLRQGAHAGHPTSKAVLAAMEFRAGRGQ